MDARVTDTAEAIAKLDRYMHNLEYRIKRLEGNNRPAGHTVCIACHLEVRDLFGAALDVIRSIDGGATERVNTHLERLNRAVENIKPVMYRHFSETGHGAEST